MTCLSVRSLSVHCYLASLPGLRSFQKSSYKKYWQQQHRLVDISLLHNQSRICKTIETQRELTKQTEVAGTNYQGTLLGRSGGETVGASNYSTQNLILFLPFVNLSNNAGSTQQIEHEFSPQGTPFTSNLQRWQNLRPRKERRQNIPQTDQTRRRRSPSQKYHHRYPTPYQSPPL